ncbi:hypothetical protein [Streptomyces sp. NPDC057002]|uniref:hypothetical protein n=1 Tax=Streptomyces sp. NPDC057002 TaxID=3345992 RepID=UPI0036361F6A
MGQHLRGPTHPPEPQELFGRTRELGQVEAWLRQHRDTRAPADRARPALMVLLGPAGVGKSALAATACRRLGPATHWISSHDAPRADAELTLLRLLAECGAPSAALVREALEGDRTFRRALREFAARLRGRLVVLDGAVPSTVRALLPYLRDCPDLAVLVTSRQRRGWRFAGCQRVDVAPLTALSTSFFITRGAERRLPADQSFWSAQRFDLTDLVRGLPALARVARNLADQGVSPQQERREGESGPQWLVRLALADCTPGQRELLGRLAERHSAAPFTLRTVESLYTTDLRLPDVRALLDGLLAHELVQRWHAAETFFLPDPVAEAVRPEAPSAEASSVVWAGRVLQDTAGLLDGRSRPEQPTDRDPVRLTPDELAPHVDEFLVMLADRHGTRRQQHRIADGLAVLLSVLGDAHRLVALHRLQPVPPVRRALGSLASDLGLPQVALALFDAASWVSLDAVHRGALVCHQSGRLGGALDVLDTLLGDDGRREDRHTAWGLLALGAVRCDRGEVAEADRALLRATVLHRASGCHRGLGWTLLHRARVYLLSGRDAEAGGLLSQADTALLAASDTRGRNWVTTERIRVALRRGGPEAAQELAVQAKQRHASAEDIRGLGWTSLYLALTHLEERDFRSADQELAMAEKYFLSCEDYLGSAWAKHRMALLPTGRGKDRAEIALVSLSPAWELFGEIDCPLGTAWTELEMAARRPPSELTMPLLSTAGERFRDLGDESGRVWVAAVETVLRNHLDSAPHRGVETLVASVPRGIRNRDRLVKEVVLFLESEGVRGGRPIPFHARDTVTVRYSGPEVLDLPGPAGTRCRVRVTLLDDSSAEDTTARLLVRVSPEDGHPWGASEADRPWLTVTASPLTPASVDPASAHLLPSEQALHGAEFTFTAHRTGTHRLRFTIALERTGTVLQQVETELDILDHDEHGGLSSPEAVTHRGR